MHHSRAVCGGGGERRNKGKKVVGGNFYDILPLSVPHSCNCAAYFPRLFSPLAFSASLFLFTVVCIFVFVFSYVGFGH